MSDAFARVGARQWRVLRAAEDQYPDRITARLAGAAISDDLPYSAHRPVIEALLAKGLLRHECPTDDHPPAARCLVVITDRGACAHLERGPRATRLR